MDSFENKLNELKEQARIEAMKLDSPHRYDAERELYIKNLEEELRSVYQRLIWERGFRDVILAETKRKRVKL